MPGRPTRPFRAPRCAAGLTLIAAALALLAFGCAGTSPSDLVEEPGVRVRVALTSGEEFSGSLIGVEGGAYVVDHSIAKSERLRVVRENGTDLVYLDGTRVGTAVEVRAVDVLVRERLGYMEVESIEAVTRGYVGWGTAVAAALAFVLVRLLQDM